MSFESSLIQFNYSAPLPRDLSELEKKYVSALKKVGRIDRMIEEEMNRGVLIHFGGLVELLRMMSEAGCITNPEVKSFFLLTAEATEGGGISQGYNTKPPTSWKELAQCPFFRNLPQPAVELLWKNSKDLRLEQGQVLFAEGDLSRDIYLTLKGNIGLYRSTPQGGKIRINEFAPGSVFGEGGFLLGNPRAGTVRTMTAGEVKSFRLPSEEFALHLDTQKVESIQPKMWALNAVLKSESLRLLPADSIDQLLFSGKSLTAQEGTAIFKEGDLGRSLFILISGSVVISQNSKVINVMKAGDCFGEIALFFSKEQRTATASAQTTCNLLEIERSAFYALLSKNIALASEIEAIALKRLENDRKRKGTS